MDILETGNLIMRNHDVLFELTSWNYNAMITSFLTENSVTATKKCKRNPRETINPFFSA